MNKKRLILGVIAGFSISGSAVSAMIIPPMIQMQSEIFGDFEFIKETISVSANKNTKMFAEPNEKSEVLYSLKKNDKFDIVGYDKTKTWVLVDFDGRNSFVLYDDVDSSKLPAKNKIKDKPKNDDKEDDKEFEAKKIKQLKEKLNVLSDKELENYTDESVLVYNKALDSLLEELLKDKPNKETTQTLLDEFNNATDKLVLKEKEKPEEPIEEPVDDDKNKPDDSNQTENPDLEKFAFPSVPGELTIIDGKTLADVNITGEFIKDGIAKTSPNLSVSQKDVSIKKGTKITVTGITTDGFCRFTHNGETLYISTDHLK